MKVLVKKKSAKEIKTKYGLKTKYNILITGPNGGDRWVEAWGSPESDTWGEGDTIDVELESREYEGKTYWDVKTVHPMEVLRRRIDALEKDVEALKGKGAPYKPMEKAGFDDAELASDLPPPHTDEDYAKEDRGEIKKTLKQQSQNRDNTFNNFSALVFPISFFVDIPYSQ